MTHTEHQAVLQALHDAMLQIEYIYEKFQKTGTGEQVLARLRSAITIMEMN